MGRDCKSLAGWFEFRLLPQCRIGGMAYTTGLSPVQLRVRLPYPTLCPAGGTVDAFVLGTKFYRFDSCAGYKLDNTMTFALYLHRTIGS